MTFRRATVVLTLSLLFITLSYSITKKLPPNQSVQESYNFQGETAYASERYSTEQLIALWEARYVRNQRDYISLTYLSQAYIQHARETGNLSDYDKAEVSLQKALDLNPNDQAALQLMSTIHLSKHQFEESLTLARRIYESDSGALQALATIGDAHIELGNYAEAEKAYQTLYKQSEAPAVIIRNARLAWLNGNSNEAITLMEQATEQAIDSGLSAENLAWYHFQLGDFYFDNGDLASSEAQFAISLAVLDDYFLAHSGLGEVYAGQGNYEAAIEQYEIALSLSPDQPDFLASLGYLYELTGQDTKAKEAYQSLETIIAESSDTETLYGRFLVHYYADGDFNLEEALALAEWDLSIRQDIYGYDALAWALYKNGRYEEAQAAMNEAVKLGTQDANLFYHAGMIQLALGNEAQAVGLLSQALEINPYFDLAKATIAQETIANSHNAN